MTVLVTRVQKRTSRENGDGENGKGKKRGYRSFAYALFGHLEGFGFTGSKSYLVTQEHISGLFNLAHMSSAVRGEPALVRARRVVKNIKAHGLSVYEAITVGDPDLWLPAPELEAILNDTLPGLSVAFPPRTRSKVVKMAVCKALGYTVPPNFAKTQPRFPGQDFDTYVQKSTNLQIWNEEIVATRRYVIFQVSDDDVVRKVKVVTGERPAELDTTGTLTQKYQARYGARMKAAELLSTRDTPTVANLIVQAPVTSVQHPRSIDYPEQGRLRSIGQLFELLKDLIGHQFPDRGVIQDRNRGGDLHCLVCHVLGYTEFEDNGSCPDITHELLEIKLQTAPTIDLGLVCPNSDDPLDVPMVGGMQLKHRDVRYLIVGGTIALNTVTVTNVYLVTGADFFKFFPQFGGKIVNKKLQIPLPRAFFDT